MSEQAEVVDWSKPIEVDEVTLAYPARVIGRYLPPLAVIPQEFEDYGNPWCRFVSTLFYQGGALPPTKEGINGKLAHRHLSAVIGSYQPSHEHKIAGAAWLASMWYTEPVVGAVPEASNG